MFTEDLDQFYDIRDFAETVQIDGQDAVVIMDVPYIENAELEDVDATAEAPTATFNAVGAQAGSTLFRPETGKTYRMVGSGQPDGTGRTTTWPLEIT